MKKLWLTFALLLCVPAYAQQVTNPIPNAGVYGAYNSAAPTCVNGTGCWLQTDINGVLKVTGSGSGGAVIVAGNVSNASSAVATSATNVPTVAYNYGFNGTTWDQLQVDASKFLKVIDSNTGLALAPVAPATATATKSELIGCQYNSTNLAFTNGQQGQIGCDQRGGLYVQDGAQVSGTATSAVTLFTVSDTSGFGSISVQVTSAGVATTITYEASEDGTTWTSVTGYAPSAIQTSSPTSTSTTALLLNFPVRSKQFRARISTYGSGTVTAQGTLKKDPLQTGVFVLGTSAVQGVVNDSGSVGGVGVATAYEGRSSNKTAVTNGTYVRPITTLVGATVNKPFQVPELDWSYVAAAGGISNTTTAVTMVASAGAGLRNYVTSCQFSSDALGAATELAIRDGAAGTVIWRMKIGTAGIINGLQQTFYSPIKSSAATLLEIVTLTASITGAVYANCQGYQAP